jgi:hypothetical protein
MLDLHHQKTKGYKERRKEGKERKERGRERKKEKERERKDENMGKDIKIQTKLLAKFNILVETHLMMENLPV